jgi:hypothetical protein
VTLAAQLLCLSDCELLSPGGEFKRHAFIRVTQFCVYWRDPPSAPQAREVPAVEVFPLGFPLQHNIVAGQSVSSVAYAIAGTVGRSKSFPVPASFLVLDSEA